MVINGIDALSKNISRFKGLKLGVLCNQASLTKELVHIVDLIANELPGSLKAIFSPQHGFSGQDQDNMVETPHAIHTLYKIPVYSLYEKEREPSLEMMEGLDVLLVDLQDVGTRVYTFSSTLLGCMRKASQKGVRVLVLDRPNPVDGQTLDGPILKETFYSFVGNLPIPMRHGLTMGELALALKDYYHIDLDLEVVPMQGWRREMYFEDTGLRWHMPSPNMPFYSTALVYTGTVLLEATNLSEGRGTTRPFEIIGAPFLDPYSLKRSIPSEYTMGIVLQEYQFKPTFNKWSKRLCNGFMIHVTNKRQFKGMVFIVAFLKAVKKAYSEEFFWKDPPYEYEYERLPIDIVSGDANLREYVDSDSDLEDLFSTWEMQHKEYLKWRRPYLLY